MVRAELYLGWGGQRALFNQGGILAFLSGLRGLSGISPSLCLSCTTDYPLSRVTSTLPSTTTLAKFRLFQPVQLSLPSLLEKGTQL